MMDHTERNTREGVPPRGAGQHLLHVKGAVKHHLFEGIASLKDNH